MCLVFFLDVQLYLYLGQTIPQQIDFILFIAHPMILIGMKVQVFWQPTVFRLTSPGRLPMVLSKLISTELSIQRVPLLGASVGQNSCGDGTPTWRNIRPVQQM
jgi:hypothetical protein